MDNPAHKYLQEALVEVEAKLRETQEMLNDPQMAELALGEKAELEKQKEQITRALSGGQEASSEETAEQFKQIILEARPGVGGEEAKIWMGDLLRMYTRFAAVQSWKTEELDEGVIKINGKGAFEAMKYETGVHRVQRVPETEAAGRVHTSTASIVVLPEVPENRIEIREDDLLWEFTRGGGHGGQNVNKVATAVRLTHRPSGIVVQSRQERFQEQNRKIALALLRAQLWEAEQEKKMAEVAGARLAIGRSMRAEKIRTYNYPQNRVTDHRIGKSWYKLERIMEGDLAEVVETVKRELTNGQAQSDNSSSEEE